MSSFKSILAMLVLMVGGVALYEALPAYWGDFKVNQMIADQAVNLTPTSKSEGEIAAIVSQKAQELSVPIAPEQVTVDRTPADLSISVAYTVHVEFPGYPFDLNFKDSTTNHNVMR